MVFSSITFLYYFLPAVLLIYAVTPGRLKNAALLLVSLVFYAWAEQGLVLLFVFSILAGWLFGLLIEKYRGTGKDRLFLWLSVILDLGALFYFKYLDFCISAWNSMTAGHIDLPGIALPIGISFYTFQILSYDIDVYRGDVEACRNPVDLGAYVAFFPQLIAGPIVRYSTIYEQLKNRKHTLAGTALGVRRFLIGLGKKVLLANVYGEVVSAYGAATDRSVLFGWLYAMAFMLQIYYDFSGYSDMAIGLAKLFGFDLLENFDYPYVSVTVTEFWRRWHISLGSWFRDYVYIPLGGNRRGKGRQLLNILVVWTLTGIWHGAAWNFLLWGAIFAVLLAVEKFWLKGWLDGHRAIGHIYVIFCVMISFVIFAGNGVREALADVAGMFGMGGIPVVNDHALYLLRSYTPAFVMGAVGAVGIPARLAAVIGKAEKGRRLLDIAEPVFLLLLLVLSTAFLVDGSFNPFLYFRF